MNTFSRIITGIVAIILGFYLILISFSEPWILIYGIPILIMGIFIFFNKKEDDIEQIKTKANGGKK